MMEQVRRLIVAVAMALTFQGASCNQQPPSPTPTPTPTPTPGPAIKYSELLLRAEGVKLVRPNSGKPFYPFGAVQCCEGTTVNGSEINTLWPLASEAWMDYAKANMYHFRMGPFYGDADHETEWAAIGGPYAGGPGSDWNPAFWNKVVALVEYAGKQGANVEVNVIDTWYCKHSASNWGDQQMPWPQSDIDACGINASPEQEKFIRKVVSTFNDYANVIWLVDNEGGEIRGTKVEWYTWVRSVIRDEEKGQIVRMVGTNNTNFCNAGFDYCATHARAALTSAIAGIHTENNERNPAFSVDQEFSNFCEARKQDLNYWFWRAGMSQANADALLAKMQRGCGGEAIGCFAPAGDDPQWTDPPTSPADRPAQMMAAYNAARAAVGDRCGVEGQCTPDREPCAPPIFIGCIDTSDLIAAELRKQGHCASGSWGGGPEIALLAPDGWWEQYHPCATENGCYTGNPYKLAWKYKGTNPTPTEPPPPATTCSKDVPVVDEILCKLHQETNHIYDCTPKANGQKIAEEGDPERSACEEKACGGTPTFSITQPEASITLVSPYHDNPYQFQLKGSGTVQIHSKCPATGNRDLSHQSFTQ